jgi:hypothetical protein
MSNKPKIVNKKKRVPALPVVQYVTIKVASNGCWVEIKDSTMFDKTFICNNLEELFAALRQLNWGFDKLKEKTLAQAFSEKINYDEPVEE